MFACYSKKVYNKSDYILGGTRIMLDIKFLRENPDVVKQNIKFIDVKTMDDVVKHALNN